jgi:hypothetical protein
MIAAFPANQFLRECLAPRLDWFKYVMAANRPCVVRLQTEFERVLLQFAGLSRVSSVDNIVPGTWHWD